MSTPQFAPSCHASSLEPALLPHQLFSTLQAVFVALALYPDVQRKAQAVLDAVVGPSRLPDFGDSDALPYVHAVVKEALRWNVVAPLGLAHCTLRDEVVRGCFVPAGTTVLPNAWCVRPWPCPASAA